MFLLCRFGFNFFQELSRVGGMTFKKAVDERPEGFAAQLINPRFPRK